MSSRAVAETTRTEGQRIEDRLVRMLEGDAWHGPAVAELLDGVDEKTAAARPIAGAHSIREIVEHLAAWAPILLRRLHGEVVNDVSAAQDWPPAGESWDAARRRLSKGYLELVRFAAARTAEGLRETVAGKDYEEAFLLNGAIEHLAYHAGQIAFLRKALGV